MGRKKKERRMKLMNEERACICMYVCMLLCINACLHVCVYLCACMHACVSICMCVRVRTYLFMVIDEGVLNSFHAL